MRVSTDYGIPVDLMLLFEVGPGSHQDEVDVRPANENEEHQPKRSVTM